MILSDWAVTVCFRCICTCFDFVFSLVFLSNNSCTIKWALFVIIFFLFCFEFCYSNGLVFTRYPGTRLQFPLYILYFFRRYLSLLPIRSRLNVLCFSLLPFDPCVIWLCTSVLYALFFHFFSCLCTELANWNIG